MGRDELASRGEPFVRGRWRELLASARNSIPTGTQKSQSARSDEERRGLAAQERVQKGHGSPKRGGFDGAP